MLKFTINRFKKINLNKLELEVENSIIQWVSESDSQGNTPLSNAVYSGNMQMIIFLEKLGANIYCVNYMKFNLIHVACSNGRILPLIYYS